jgi:hypothetical protein
MVTVRGRAPVRALRRLDDLLVGGWALVPVVGLLYLNLASGRIFDQDRSAAIRLLTQILVAATLGRAFLVAASPSVNGDSPPWRRWRIGRVPSVALPDSWLIVLPLAFGAAVLASTAAALHPHRAFWGSYERSYGAALDLAGVAIALGVAWHARRSKATVPRILRAAHLGAAGAALVAVLQFLGQDVFPLATSGTSRPAGTVGNPLFLGAALAMALPLAVALAVGRWQARLASRDGGTGGSGEGMAGEIGRGLVAAGALTLVLAGLIVAFHQRDDLRMLWVWPLTLLVAATAWMAATEAGPFARWPPSLVGGQALVLAGIEILVPRADAPGAGLVLFWLGLTLGLLLAADWVARQRSAGVVGRLRGVPLDALGWAALAALEAAALVATASRGPLMGAIAGIALVVVVARLRAGARGWRGDDLVVGGLVVAALVLAVVFVSRQREQAPIDFASGTGLERRLIWLGDERAGGVLALIGRDPARLLVGWGAESLGLLIGPVYPPSLGPLVNYGVPDRAHMVPLDLLIDFGLVGLAAWLGVAVLACLRAWRAARDGPPASWPVAAGLLGCMVAHLVEGLVGIVVVPTLVLWWMAVGLASAVGTSSASPASRASGIPVRRSLARTAVVLMAVGLVLATAPLHLRTEAADLLLVRASALESRGAAAPGAVAAAFVQAAVADPNEPVFDRVLGDFLWRQARRALAEDRADLGVPPPPSLPRDPGLARDFVDAAGPDDLLSAAGVAYESAHRLLPEAYGTVIDLARLDVVRMDLTEDPARLESAAHWYREATVRAPFHFQMLSERAEVDMRLAEIARLDGRPDAALAWLDEARQVLDCAYRSGVGRFERFDPLVRAMDAKRAEIRAAWPEYRAADVGDVVPAVCTGGHGW